MHGMTYGAEVGKRMHFNIACCLLGDKTRSFYFQIDVNRKMSFQKEMSQRPRVGKIPKDQ